MSGNLHGKLAGHPCTEDAVMHRTGNETQILQQKAACALRPPFNSVVDPIEIAIGNGIGGSVAQPGMAEIIPDTPLDNRYIVDDAYRLSVLLVPVINNRKMIGVINSKRTQKDFNTAKTPAGTHHYRQHR